ncbi:hypothetical protein JOC78_000845 [Bacillus ectoiniformans]|uniref:hypothetical protein n=1 Tax=Bacillus ectoiniformans TaxID=1494429 RepID=UPI00195D2037|nr:hypothetical protein [Bacillus ectoiniformans]MBM7647905.1 hypothetical protein [Bacillus ectoiniformans]
MDDRSGLRLKYGDKTYTSLEQMTKSLLHEANEIIIKIDMGQLKNEAAERNHAKFRLMHLQRNFVTCVPENDKAMYNSLWSQLYRLEHEDHYVNPFLKSIFFKMQEIKK